MRNQMADGMAEAILEFPITKKDEPKFSWLVRLGNLSGVTMATTESPRGWSFNPAVITLALIIGGMIATGAYYMGQRDNEQRHLLERIEKAEQDAAEAKKFGIYAAAGADEQNGHKPNQQKKEK